MQGYADARLHEHVLHSVKLVLLGLIAAVGVGVPLGLAMGRSRRAEASSTRIPAGAADTAARVDSARDCLARAR